MKPSNYYSIVVIAVITILGTACGGGSGGGDPVDPVVESGTFIDSAVEGLRFETPTQSGLTDNNGTFKYIKGEAVSFYIGDILLGTSTGAKQVTPMNFVPGSSSNNPQVINILRFVQSLDEDNNPDNGIRIPGVVAAQALGQALDFSHSTVDFENAANALLALLTSGAVNSLIDASSAKAHFIASLNIPSDVLITGTPICDDFGGQAEFGCRIVSQADLALTVADDTASIFVGIENSQYIELFDTDGDQETIAVAIFVTNSGTDIATVSMNIGLTDKNGLVTGSASATDFPLNPGFSGLVAFTANIGIENLSPVKYYGMLLNIEVTGGSITFGEFGQANIFPVELTSNVGNDGNDNPCGAVVEIGPNSIINGVLEAGDCLVSDIDPTIGDSSFVDEYRIVLNSTGTLTINMRSASIDSYLVLLDRSTSCSSGCTPVQAILITEDDDSGGGVNGFDALISMDLAAGTYIIIANSVLPETGSYTLETMF